NLFGHARPGVFDTEQDVVGVRCVGAYPILELFGRNAFGRDRQSTSLRQGVARVDRKVEQDLFELSVVCGDGRNLGVEVEAQRNILAERRAQHALDSRDHVVELEYMRLNYTAATESEELLGEVGGAVAGRQHFLQVVAAVVVGAELRKE